MIMALKKFGTNTAGAVTHEMTEITDVKQEDLRFEQTVGDEMWIESGDLILKTYTPDIFLITAFPQPDVIWVALYINDILADVYRDIVLDSYDEKTGMYEYRLSPIQKIFLDDLKNTLVRYSADTDSWNYNIGDSDLIIKEITLQTGGTPVNILNVYGFSLVDLVNSHLGQHNDYGYAIGSTTQFGPVLTSDNLPILFRGNSVTSGLPLSEAIDKTFYEDGAELFHMTWFDLYQLAIFGWNAFIWVRPVFVTNFGTDYLNVYLRILPRINQAPSGPIEDLVFAERKRIYGKHRIDGVRLTGLNFTYEQGAVGGDNVFTREVAIADYDEDEPYASTTLYWAVGDYDSGVGKYDLTFPYFASGIVENYYLYMISDGDGIEAKCEIVYNDGSEKVLKVLDQVTIGDDTFQVTRIRQGGKSALAEIEGIVILTGG